MTSKTASYVFVSAVFVLSLLDAGLAQSRPACNLTRKSVAEGSPNIQEDCQVPSAEHTVIWRIIVNGSSQEVEIATCPPAPANCTVTPLSQIKSRLTWDASNSTRSQLTIDGPIKRQTAPRQIKCDAIKSGSQLVSVKLVVINVFVQGRNECMAGPFDENGVFKLGGRCNFTNTYSTLDCDRCTWFEVIDIPPAYTAKSLSKIPSDQTTVEDLVTGSDGSTNYSCAFKKELPSTEGKYTISMEAEHSRVRSDVSRFEIRNPSKPTHNCPVYVAEGESVRCMCEPHDLGKPARALPAWSQTSNQRLVKDNVRRLDDGSVFTCGFLQGPSINYTLRVAYGPDEVHIASTSSRALACIPIHVNPTPRFLWTRHDTGEVGKEQTLDIDLDNVTQRWVVDCVVTNVENNGKSATARVDTDTLRKGNLTFAQGGNAAESGDRFGTGLAIGVCIALAIAAAVFFVLILALRTRGWALPCSRVSKDQPKRQKKGESNHPLLNAEGRDSSRQTSEDGAFRVELEAAVSARTADERGHPEGASNYDMLDKTQAQTVSPYDSLQPRSAAAIDTLQTIPEDDSGPMYANRDCFVDSAPVYANSYPGKPNMESSSDETPF